MRSDKDVATALRRAGKSYREIRKETGASLSTLCLWFKDLEWSKDIGKKLIFQQISDSTTKIIELNKIRGSRLDTLYDLGRKVASQEFEKLKTDPLFVAGIVAYWGEGDKATKHLCRLANSDPAMVRLFWLFLTKKCGIPGSKISCWLILYPDLDEQVLKKRWSLETKIPIENFKKATFIRGRHPTKRNGYGICSIVVSSRFFKEKMLVWLRLIAEEMNADMV
ncbi:MAG: hypothetical protein V4474_01385 [Patescibacteria group bacterium]